MISPEKSGQGDQDQNIQEISETETPRVPLNGGGQGRPFNDEESEELDSEGAFHELNGGSEEDMYGELESELGNNLPRGAHHPHMRGIVDGIPPYGGDYDEDHPEDFDSEEEPYGPEEDDFDDDLMNEDHPHVLA